MDKGEIFNATGESLTTPQEQQPQQLEQAEQSTSSAMVESPPPFIEDKRKKIIIFFVIIIFFLLLLILVAGFLLKPKTKPPENVTLNYWGLWEEKEIVQPIFDDYQKSHPHVTVNYVKQDPKQYRERLQAAIERGEGPDIYRFHNTWLPMLKDYLSPMPKDIYTEEEFSKTFYPVVSNDLKKGGNIYGVPLMIDGLLLFYNEDMLKGVNISPPKTWSDVQKAAPKLTVKENEKIKTAGIALGSVENIEHFSDIIGLMLLQNGTEINSSLFTCSDKSSAACAVEAVTFYRSFAEMPNGVWDETLENSIVAFAGGKVAMILAPSWQANVVKEIDRENKINFKTASVPQLPCDKEPCPSVNWASYWVEGVSSKNKNPTASWELLKYLSSAEVETKLFAEQVKYRKLFGEPYSRVDLGKNLTDNSYLAPLISQAPTMKSFYSASRTFDGETGLNSSINKYLKDAINSLSQGTSIETALKTADSGIQQVYKRFGLTASGD